MFNLEITHNTTYGEISQPNPMRWRIMYRKKDKLIGQSGLMKCKDFFNDIVAYRKTKHEFSIYGFKNSTIKFNRWGLYFHLTNISNPEKFIQNVEKTLNVKLKEQLNTTVRLYPQDNNSVVIRIPLKLWDNTYYISLATMVLRLCNYGDVYESWEDLYKPGSPINTVDHAFNAKAKEYTKTNGFLLPEKYRKYWFFAGAVNSESNSWKNAVTIVHNCGCNTWLHFVDLKGTENAV